MCSTRAAIEYSANGPSYACNGADGQNGQSFNGTFTSPNGQYKLIVNDTTARLEGPIGRVQITSNGVDLSATGPINVNAQNALTLHAAGLFSASGGLTTIGGSSIFLNGSSCGLFRPVDIAPAVGPGGGPILLNPAGSPTVRFAC